MKKSFYKIFFASIILSFILLYVLGNIWEIESDTKVFANSFLLLLLFKSLFFSLLVFFLYKLLIIITTHKPGQAKLLFISTLISLPLLYYTLNPPFLYSYNPPLSQLYLMIGDPLRDQYGINWYWMDWGNWMTTVALYLFPIYTYVIYQLINSIFYKASLKKIKK